MEKLCCKLRSAEPSVKKKFLVGSFMVLSFIIAAGFSLHWVYSEYEWINVHLIPHSHDDVGWLRTPENYYDYCVREILDNVITELSLKQFRKFVYSEIYFFWKWWQDQSDETKSLVKDLLKNGQLEIVGGGWCQSDEAVTHYQSFIDQMTWGFRRLNDTLGPDACPKVGWQIDTFGHSKGIASLLAQMGLHSLFFARLDYRERKYRKSGQLMEFLWWGNENIGESASIFTSIFYNHYSAPNGFDFELNSNYKALDVSSFSQYARSHAKAFRTNHIFVPMGDDFRYMNARKYFDKIDELINFFDNNPDFKLKVFYSTPTLYLQKLQDSNILWPDKHGDFFPYASDSNSYWTGYYTSRPTLKYFERIANNFLQIGKHLLVFAQVGMKFFEELTNLREAVGVLQHHDALTGTSQQHVTNHYSRLLYEGIVNCTEPIDFALGKLSKISEVNGPSPVYQSCMQLNISLCPVTESSEQFVVTVYNPLSRKINHYVRVPITGLSYSVFESTEIEIPSQIVPIPQVVKNIPGRMSLANSELIFKAINIPALGFKSYYVVKRPDFVPMWQSLNVFEKKDLKVIFNNRTHLFSGFKVKTENVSVTQSIKYYKSSEMSGAYIFHPRIDVKFDVGTNVQTKVLSNGILVEEHEQVFCDWASQIIRMYKDEDYVEFEWLIGPIPFENKLGKEIISIYSSSIDSKRTFFTDVNGMEMEKRKRNYRDWEGEISKIIEGNYYPVTSMISIKDSSHEMYLVVDRPQGGSSLKSGEVELMIHRRLFNDDGRGVNEALNETAFEQGLVVRGRHWLLYGKKQLQLKQKAKLFAQSRHSEPWLFFFDAKTVPILTWSQNFVTEFSGIYSYVPRNVRILTLEPWRENSILLRLEHVFQKIPFSSLSNAPVAVSLKEMFTNFEVIEARETTLGADRWLYNWERQKWRTAEKTLKVKEAMSIPNKNFTVVLLPQQIRTFILKIRPKDN